MLVKCPFLKNRISHKQKIESHYLVILIHAKEIGNKKATLENYKNNPLNIITLLTIINVTLIR